MPSLLGVMLASGMPRDSVRANIKLAISGGQNEPRDAIAGAVWALLTHPRQLALVREGNVPWLQAFEEYARWISPIGMSPRRIARPWRLRDVDFAPEDRIFFMFGSANRDAAVFERADEFDVTRDIGKSVAFGAGPHFCAGAWASRAMVAEAALPAIFARLPQLRLDETKPIRIVGWAFRGRWNCQRSGQPTDGATRPIERRVRRNKPPVKPVQVTTDPRFAGLPPCDQERILR